MRKVLILLMAGEGKRFLNENIFTPKPFLKTKNSVLYLEILKSFNFFDQIIIIANEKHKNFLLSNEINYKNLNINFFFLTHSTKGQADTLLKSEKFLKDNDKVVVAPCDLIIYDNLTNIDLFKKDFSVWCFNNDVHLNENPEMYSWVLSDKDNEIKKFSPKKNIIHHKYESWALSGYFSFYSANFMIKNLKKIISNNVMINNEFYIDSVIELALKNNNHVNIIKLNDINCLGTPSQYLNYINETN